MILNIYVIFSIAQSNQYFNKKSFKCSYGIFA